MLQSEDLKLSTRRLTLRRPTLEDAPAVQALVANWNIAKWLGRLPWPYPADGAASWISAMAPACDAGSKYVFGIFLKDAPETGLIGCIGIEQHEDGQWELGYWLGEPYWGNGLMTEAANRAVTFAFEDAGIARLEAGHFLGNGGSARVLLRCGFEYLGERRRWCEARKENIDSMEMELSREKWLAYRPAVAAE